MKKSISYLILRTLNSVLTMVWGFALTAIMVRAVGVDEYSRYVLILAFGIYLTMADFGVSFLVYSRLREAYLKNQIESCQQAVRAAVSLYFAATIAATVIFLILGAWLFPRDSMGFAAPSAFFIVSALNLPWIIVRVISGAVERYMIFEVVDAVRRTLHIALIVLMLVDWSPVVVFVLANVVWVAAYAASFHWMRPSLRLRPRDFFWPDAAGLRAFLAEFGSNVGASMIFSLTEFAIYNFPYLYVPAIYGSGTSIVIFDVFYKFFRAATTANRIASTGLLPQLSRAYHLGSRRGLVNALGLCLGISSLAMLTLSGIVLVGGHIIFPLLLNNQAHISQLVVFSIVIVAVANGIQNTFGGFVVNVGGIRLGFWLSSMIALAMAAMAAWGAQTDVPLEQFIFYYALLYFAGSCPWAAYGTLIAIRKSRAN